MLTAYELHEFNRQKDSIADSLLKQVHGNSNILLFKVLVNYLEKTNISGLRLDNLDESIFKDSKELKERFAQILEHMATIAAEETEHSPTYTTGQLAKFFGVSITTINNWINKGRFIGVERKERNKQARISANTKYKAPSGEIMFVKDVVEMYNEAENDGNLNNSNELEFLVTQLAMYEGKYGGEYDKTLGNKPFSGMTPEEQTDAAAWRYFLEQVENVNRSS
ncbi:helix-turn-helix domain-containing protein [Lentibacillus sp. Marseille-P4043]|uniref:helix-turn-helix domain-containing protein n=1 Tax=Lentibacillus sp. Marseille-P4043 TaxID=2040293 RepID=UPI00131A55BE|nr:helix-turn-helix domain-containing protein [Lentibacillus sp. Marseille-P4043]